MVSNHHTGRSKFAGQSITEFTVVLTLLAPLILVLPAVSKLFEVKNKATHMARLSAWQPHDTRGGSDDNQRDAIMQAAVLSNAQVSRVLEKPDAVAWDPMLVAKDPIITATETQFQTAASIESKWMSIMESAVNLGSITGFPLKAKGLETHQVHIAAKIPDQLTRWLDLDSSDSSFDYNLSLFSDAWKSNTAAEQVALVSSMTPASLLPTDNIQSFLKLTTGFMPWASAWKTLKLGRVEPQIIPSQSIMQVAQ